MPNRWNTSQKQAQLRRMEHNYRIRGYEDGYAGRPCASTNIVYARAWRQGQAARRAEGFSS